MNACPYQARYFNPDTDAAGDGRYPSQVPGTVDKCDFCLHRVDNGVVPSCVNTCPANARVFGDLNDPESQAHAIVAGGATETLLPRFGTSPSVFYVGGDPSVFEGE
jgi:tetrathionate reductase subunit B